MSPVGEEEDQITLSTRGKIAIITLNRPEKLNALNFKLYYRLACLMREVAERNDIFVTVLTGKGRGADQTLAHSADADDDDAGDVREKALRTFVPNNLNITHAFYTHPKILVTALNGPAVGLSAALIALSDFVYAAPHAFLLTPFTSLGLVAEGGASRAFVQRMGSSKANEALIMSKKMTAHEMVQVGFVNRIFDTPPKESDRFLARVLEEVEEWLGDHVNGESMMRVKALIRRPERELLDGQTVAEVMGGWDRMASGIPMEEFRKLATGERKHKL